MTCPKTKEDGVHLTGEATLLHARRPSKIKIWVRSPLSAVKGTRENGKRLSVDDPVTTRTLVCSGRGRSARPVQRVPLTSGHVDFVHSGSDGEGKRKGK